MKEYKEREAWMTWLLLLPLFSVIFCAGSLIANGLSTDPFYQHIFREMGKAHITNLMCGFIDIPTLYYCAYRKHGTALLKLGIVLNYLSILVNILIIIYIGLNFLKVDFLFLLILSLGTIVLRLVWIKKCRDLRTLNIKIRSDAARQSEEYRLLIENMERAKTEDELQNSYFCGVREYPEIEIVLKCLYQQRKKELKDISDQVEITV